MGNTTACFLYLPSGLSFGSSKTVSRQIASLNPVQPVPLAKGRSEVIRQKVLECLLFINMLRVLLKIDRVCIRIKEAVELHIVIKKGQKCLTHCKRQPLINGQLSLNKSTQFFITPHSPTFEIEIYLVKGHLKKHGGVVAINLSHYAMNASHRIAAVIQKTPLPNSTLELDFVFMLTNQPFGGQELIAQGEIQSISHTTHLNSISKQNQHLMEEKNRLTSQIEELKSRNMELEGANRFIEESQENRRQKRKMEMTTREQERSNTLETLELEKQRIAQIVDIINQSGNYQLISQLEGLIHNEEPHESMSPE